MVTTVYCVHLMCFHLAPIVRKMDSAIRYIARQVLLTFPPDSIIYGRDISSNNSYVLFVLFLCFSSYVWNHVFVAF